MGAGGLEPPQSCDLRILSPLRLPIPPCPRPGILDFGRLRIHVVALPGFLSHLSSSSLLVLGAYLVLGGLYLVVMPLALLWWLKTRWTVMGKIERTLVYGLVFLFFPGLILFAPFFNLRMAGQGEVGG
jgi:NAD(P)H-quinone oxidoreductase subunit L